MLPSHDRHAVRRVHNLSASQILDHKDDYYCNWPVKGLPNQPDFRQKHQPHGGIYLSDIRRHSDHESVKKLVDAGKNNWPSEWHSSWEHLSQNPAEWLDYRDFKAKTHRSTYPDFKPKDPTNEHCALWLSSTFDHYVPKPDQPLNRRVPKYQPEP